MCGLKAPHFEYKFRFENRQNQMLSQRCPEMHIRAFYVFVRPSECNNVTLTGRPFVIKYFFLRCALKSFDIFRIFKYKYNVTVNNTTLYCIYNKNSILSGRHISTFLRSSSGPLEKQIQELSIFQWIVRSQMFTDCVT